MQRAQPYHPLRPYRVCIHNGELAQIQEWVMKYQHTETGGDLFGLWADKQTAVVQFVLGPGKGSQHNSVSFFQNSHYLEMAGSVLATKHGLCHIGEWHSHHRLGLAEPSHGDQTTVKNNMPKYNWKRFIVFIANITSLREHSSGYSSRDYVGVGCFFFEAHTNSVQMNRSQLHVIPDHTVDFSLGCDEEQSPFRSFVTYSKSLGEAVCDGAESTNLKGVVDYKETLGLSNRRSYPAYLLQRIFFQVQLMRFPGSSTSSPYNQQHQALAGKELLGNNSHHQNVAALEKDYSQSHSQKSFRATASSNDKTPSSLFSAEHAQQNPTVSPDSLRRHQHQHQHRLPAESQPLIHLENKNSSVPQRNSDATSAALFESQSRGSQSNQSSASGNPSFDESAAVGSLRSSGQSAADSTIRQKAVVTSSGTRLWIAAEVDETNLFKHAYWLSLSTSQKFYLKQIAKELGSVVVFESDRVAIPFSCQVDLPKSSGIYIGVACTLAYKDEKYFLSVGTSDSSLVVEHNEKPDFHVGLLKVVFEAISRTVKAKFQQQY